MNEARNYGTLSVPGDLVETPSQWHDAVQDFGKAIDNLITLFIEQLKKVEWDGVVEAFHAISKRRQEWIIRLGEFGWTIPSELPYAGAWDEVGPSNQKDADSYFVEFYRTNDRENMRAVVRHLTESPRSAKWHTLLEQIGRALERNDYAIVVPSLITILEGHVAQFADPSDLAQLRDTNVIRRVKQIHSEVNFFVYRDTNELRSAGCTCRF